MNTEESRSDVQSDCKYQRSFSIFTEEFVMTKIIKGQKIYDMKRVKAEFDKTVARVENLDASSYKTYRLKRRLKNTFPQLVFHSPKARSRSDIVFAKCLDTGKVAETFMLQEQLSEASDTEEEEENEDRNETERNATSANHRSSLKEMYFSALSLREIFRDCTAKHWYTTWPPVAADINVANVKKLVPPVIFNFFAWALGFSDDPEESKYVNLEDDRSLKLFSVCQDLLYIFSSGRMQTPKSLALAMAVRQISGCSNLITLLNGYGHCVSLSSTMAYDTALAQLSLNASNVIPKGFIAEHHVNVVYDNIDFGEEAGKQTHVTNGIIIQEITSQNNDDNNGETTVIKKTQRSLKVPDITLKPYSIGVKRTSIFDISDSIEHYGENAITKLSLKTDLAYVLVKMLNDYEESPLLGWTGFSIMLYEAEIPKESRIGYLPVIDNSPTEYSTINTILENGVNIANALQLDHIVMVFDEAVYSKVQQVRWKNELFYNKLIVRLGEFHTIMSFLSAISRLFEDAGLKVKYFQIYFGVFIELVLTEVECI